MKNRIKQLLFTSNRLSTQEAGCHAKIDHFTVVCSVTWPLNGSEARGDLDTDLTASKVTFSLAAIQRPGHQEDNTYSKMVYYTQYGLE